MAENKDQQEDIFLHTVEKGDTLYGIIKDTFVVAVDESLRNNEPELNRLTNAALSQVKKYNNLSSDDLQIGQKIQIPESLLYEHVSATAQFETKEQTAPEEEEWGIIESLRELFGTASDENETPEKQQPTKTNEAPEEEPDFLDSLKELFETKVKPYFESEAEQKAEPKPEDKQTQAAPEKNKPEATTQQIESVGNIRYFRIGNEKFEMSREEEQAMRTVAERMKIPFKALAAIAARESSIEHDNENPSSKACGLYQFMTNRVETLYEVAYKHAAKYGYPEARDLVERYTKRTTSDGKPVWGYRAIDGDAKNKLVENYCKTPQFNADMWEAYNKRDIEKYNEFLGSRTISGIELTLMNNIGRVGLQAFFKQIMADKKEHGGDISKGTKAIDFFNSHKRLFGGDVSANRTLLYHPDGSHKTVREAYKDLEKFGGYNELKETAAPQPQAALDNDEQNTVVATHHVTPPGGFA